MILRLLVFQKLDRDPGKEIRNIYESDCGNVWRKDGKLNAAVNNLIDQGMYNIVQGIGDSFEVVEVKK